MFEEMDVWIKCSMTRLPLDVLPKPVLAVARNPVNPSGMLEICIDSVASARAAADGGADRVELCAGLPEGGTTPSAGMIRSVRAVFPGRVMVIIRPRGYDFLYSDDEIGVMSDDIRVARDLGADGVVIGCLNADGNVDTTRCALLMKAAGPLDITFHRAFDMARDLPAAMEAILALGIKRILSSGGRASVPEGANMLAELIRRANGRAIIMPGGGITPDNLADVLRVTGAREIHLSARHDVPSGMIHRNPGCSMGTFTRGDEYTRREASAAMVRRCKETMDTHFRPTGL